MSEGCDHLEIACRPKEVVTMKPLNGKVQMHVHAQHMKTVSSVYNYMHYSYMQVYIKKVDFWGEHVTVESMTLQHTLKIYPPKVTMTVRPSTSAPQVLTITVSNVREEDNLDEEIAFPFSMFLTVTSCIDWHTIVSYFTQATDQDYPLQMLYFLYSNLV